VCRVLLTPLAILLKLYFTLNQLLILSAPVVDALAFSARKFYKLFLCHAPFYTILGSKRKASPQYQSSYIRHNCSVPDGTTSLCENKRDIFRNKKEDIVIPCQRFFIRLPYPFSNKKQPRERERPDRSESLTGKYYAAG